jgi:type VI secretion system secreted protein VgrG
MPVRTLTLVVEGLPDEVDVEVLHFEGHEAMSQLFDFDITVASTAAIDFAQVIRKKATLTVDLEDDSEPRVFHGIVGRIEQGNPEEKWSPYRLALVPRVWLLLHRIDSRIFQTLSVPEIVQQVLTGGGLANGTDFKLSVQNAYTTRDYCVQYRESDWDFVSRLLEEEGIFYYLDQTASGDVLVMADQVTAYPPIDGDDTLVFRSGAGVLGPSTTPGNHVSRFQLAEQVRSGKTTLRDWNFEKPSLLLESNKAGAVDSDLEVYDYPAEFQLKADGDDLAQVRIDELVGWRQTGGGESACSRLATGRTMTLAEHPRASFNTGYLITRIAHWGTRAEADRSGGEGERQPLYRNEFELIPAATLFRPPRVTRRPHIHGVQTASVVGPAGEEIYVDEHCRVKVQFHWDRLGHLDEKSSCWVRVAQTWASGAFGAMFIPRIKDEVVVTFLEGDPDQPLIVGSIYHGTNVPPYALPDNKTRSTVKSNTSPGGGGSNELRFEDKKSSEEVFLHAQKDWTIGVENDKNQKVGHDETLEVDHDRTKTVKNDQTGTVDHDDTLTVKHDQSLTVQNDRSVTVQNDHTESVTGNQSITIGKAQTLAVSDKQDVSVSKTRSLKVDGDVSETFGAKLTVAVTGDVSETLSGKRTVAVSGDHSESVGGKESISITGDSVETVSGKKTFTVTGDVTITSGASTVTIKPSGEITIQGTQMKLDASGPLQIHGATIDVKADAQATLKAPIVSHSADGVHTLKGAVLVLDAQMINVG